MITPGRNLILVLIARMAAVAKLMALVRVLQVLGKAPIAPLVCNFDFFRSVLFLFSFCLF